VTRLLVTLPGLEVCREHGRRWGVVGCRTCPLDWCDERDVEVDAECDGADCEVEDAGAVVPTHPGDPWARKRYALNDAEKQQAVQIAREKWTVESNPEAQHRRVMRSYFRRRPEAMRSFGGT